MLLLACSAALALVSAQSSDSAEAAARKALFASCGGAEVGTLPTGVQPGIYQGTLGTQAITLELVAKLGETGSGTQDRYRYDRYGVSIALERGRAANRTANFSLLAVESVWRGGDFAARGCLNLAADQRVAGGAALRGEWFTPGGKKRLAVTLSRVNVAAVPLALPASPGLSKLRSNDPFIFLALNRTWGKVAGGLEEPLTGVSYPRVVGGSPALNLALHDGQLRMAQEALDCLSGSGENLDIGTDYSGSGTLSWKSARLVSLHEEAEFYCGGAHPDNYTAGVTLDARTGRDVKLAGRPGTLWPGLNPQKTQALYLAGYPKDADPECLDTVSAPVIGSEYDNYMLYLTARGLALWPTYLPHVVGACAEVVTVPYSRLRVLADSGSLYFRDLYSR